MPLGSLSRTLPDDASERVVLALDCANERRLGPDPALVEQAPLVVDIDHHHDNTRFGPDQPDRPGRVLDREILYDLFRRARRRADPRDRGGALHRARHGHGALPVREHDAEGTPARRRARRGRRERPPGLPGRLRERRVRQAEAARSGARQGARLRGRARDRRRPRATDFGRRGRRSRSPRASSTSARGRGRRARGPHPRAAHAERPHAAREPAHAREGIDVSAIARKSGGGGHRQAAGFSSEASPDEIVDFIRREFLAQASSATGPSPPSAAHPATLGQARGA